MKHFYTACALTGHRELPPDFDKNALFDRLESLIKEEGCGVFLCGMAQGFDLEALDCLVQIKRERPCFVEACIPYDGFERQFAPHYRRMFEELLPWCDRETVLFPAYRDGCFLYRDRYMVERADVVLAYCTKQTGGAYYTVNYAKRQGIPVLYL